MKNIKAIIFDLGGVLFNIDYQKTIHQFSKLGISQKKYLYSKKYQSVLFDKLETGNISPKKFLLSLQKESKNKNIKEIEKAWNSMLLNLPKQRIDMLKKIKSKKKIFLLSNTNSIHIDGIKKILGNSAYSEFISLFEKVYFSHKIKIRKPDSKSFNLILRENKLNQKEVIFVDDSIQHIMAARKIGIKTILIDKGQEITKLLSGIIQ